MFSRIKGKNIILGVTGGIAAYKACEIVRELVRREASVRAVMTKNACEFITPLTLQTLSGHRVATDTFDLSWESEIGHIHLADSAELIIVAPATASFIGKIATGIADSLLSTVILATQAPVMICPAMNVNMYANSVVQDNINKLREHGFKVLEPGEGDLACGWEGKGRLTEVSQIAEETERIFSPQDFSQDKVLVTAGATREFIDSVRFISNPSSGKMGYAIARAGWQRGAEVTLVSGKADIPTPYGVDTVNVTDAEEMYEAVMSRLDWATVVIKAAAVGDYTPAERLEGKLKKESRELTLSLKRTRDILLDVGNNKDGKIVVGFAAEEQNIVENTRRKLKEKNADLIIANDISKPGSGFGEDTNVAYLLDGSGDVNELPLMTKPELADRILDKITMIRASS